MRKTAIVLVGVIALLAMTTAPVAAEEANEDEVEAGPCVKVGMNPPGVAVDPLCVLNLLPDTAMIGKTH